MTGRVIRLTDFAPTAPTGSGHFLGYNTASLILKTYNQFMNYFILLAFVLLQLSADAQSYQLAVKNEHDEFS